MKVLIVEDDPRKQECIADFLKSRNIDMHLEKAVNPGVRYACEHKDEISGIILDLGLTTEDYSTDYEWENGIELIVELAKKNINIPILINSSTMVKLASIMAKYSSVKGQMYVEDDYQTLESFINSL